MEDSTFNLLLVKHYVAFNRWVFVSVNNTLRYRQELPRQKKTLYLSLIWKPLKSYTLNLTLSGFASGLSRYRLRTIVVTDPAFLSSTTWAQPRSEIMQERSFLYGSPAVTPLEACHPPRARGSVLSVHSSVTKQRGTESKPSTLCRVFTATSEKLRLIMTKHLLPQKMLIHPD